MMSFSRVVVIAMMTNLFGRSDGGFLEYMAVIAIGAVLWLTTSEPFPDAIDKALERYANKWRGR